MGSSLILTAMSSGYAIHSLDQNLIAARAWVGSKVSANSAARLTILPKTSMTTDPKAAAYVLSDCRLSSPCHHFTWPQANPPGFLLQSSSWTNTFYLSLNSTHIHTLLIMRYLDSQWKHGSNILTQDICEQVLNSWRSFGTLTNCVYLGVMQTRSDSIYIGSNNNRPKMLKST